MPEIVDQIIIVRYRQLVKAMTELTAILNPILLNEYIVQASARLVEAESAWMLLPDQVNHTLNFETGCSNTEKQYLEQLVPIDNSLEGWVYLNQQPVIINDLGKYDLSFGYFANSPGNGAKSLMILPVTIRAKRIFILIVANRHSGDFTQFDQEILNSFLHLAAICIDKSHRVFQSDLIPELVHELRTPLAALNTALHLMQRSDLPEEKREHISDMIQSEFTRLTDLTTSFLDYTRLESGKEKFKYTQFDMSQLISDSLDIIRMQFEGMELTISADIPADPLLLTADRDKIKQVILNLVNNAIKYNQLGGYIKIIARSTPTHISISVEDSGQGIPPEYLPRLFERFFRMPNVERQIKGTGLGLTICKQIVEAHNGKINVSSTVGKGSTFTIQLPINGEFS